MHGYWSSIRSQDAALRGSGFHPDERSSGWNPDPRTGPGLAIASTLVFGSLRFPGLLFRLGLRRRFGRIVELARHGLLFHGTDSFRLVPIERYVLVFGAFQDEVE